MNKTLRTLLDEFVRRYDLSVIRGKRHWKVKHPSGRMTTVSESPSDRRALDNIRRDLRRLCQGDLK